MTTSEPSPRQARQALRWVIRCSAGPLPERQQRTLQRWLQSDPRHALAWRQQQAFWQRLDAAGPEVLAALPELTADRQGLRPIAPLLVRMSNALTPETRAAIKREWVALFMDLLDPLCRPDFELFAGNPEPAEMQYVLAPG